MSNPILTATLRAKDETAGTLKSIVRGFTGAFTDIAKVAVGVLLRDVTRAMVGIGKESLKLGSQIETLQNSFNALNQGVGADTLSLDTLRKSVDGTVADVDLLTEANKALALGLPTDQLNDLFSAARKVGAAMGRTTLQSVQDLTTGIGRQSKLILDNLGIIINTETAYEDYAKSIGKVVTELTDEERKTAFTTAAITSLNQKAAILGDNISSLTTLNEQFNTSMTNLKTEIGTFLIPIVSDLAKRFTDDWMPSIRNIVDLFRSRDFEGIGTLIRDTFNKAIDRVTGYLASVDWLGVWNRVVEVATDVWSSLQARVKSVIDSVNWDAVWATLYDYASTIWESVKTKLMDWGAKFKSILPQSPDEWHTVWVKLFDFAGKLWSDYFAPALGEIYTLFQSWLPSNTTEWANIWYGLWEFGKELWNRLVQASGDIAKVLSDFVMSTNWEPLLKAFKATIGKAVTGAMKWGVEQFFVSVSFLGILTKIIRNIVEEILGGASGGGGGGGGVPPSTPGFIPPDILPPSPPYITPSKPGAPSNVSYSINIGSFIGLNEATTRRQLRNILAEIDVEELQRRGVRL